MKKGILYKIVDGVLVKIEENEKKTSQEILVEIENKFDEKKKKEKSLNKKIIILLSTMILSSICVLMIINMAKADNYFYKACYLYFGVSAAIILQVVFILIREIPIYFFIKSVVKRR